MHAKERRLAIDLARVGGHTATAALLERVQTIYQVRRKEDVFIKDLNIILCLLVPNIITCSCTMRRWPGTCPQMMKHWIPFWQRASQFYTHNRFCFIFFQYLNPINLLQIGIHRAIHFYMRSAKLVRSTQWPHFWKGARMHIPLIRCFLDYWHWIAVASSYIYT